MTHKFKVFSNDRLPDLRTNKLSLGGMLIFVGSELLLELRGEQSGIVEVVNGSSITSDLLMLFDSSEYNFKLVFTEKPKEHLLFLATS